jgi:hypothetical protein
MCETAGAPDRNPASLRSILGDITALGEQCGYRVRRQRQSERARISLPELSKNKGTFSINPAFEWVKDFLPDSSILFS